MFLVWGGVGLAVDVEQQYLAGVECVQQWPLVAGWGDAADFESFDFLWADAEVAPEFLGPSGKR